MPSLKDLRNRISSVKATQKITKAMQMVAAAKLRRAQEAAEAARPYADRMDEVLGNLSLALKDYDIGMPLLTGTGSDKTQLLIVATAERGLCGAFNTNIAKLARDDALRLADEGKTVKFLCVGKKGHDILRRQFPDQIVDLIDLRQVRRLSFANARDVADRVCELFDEGEFDVCRLYFSRFKSVISQTPMSLQLIPTRLPDTEEGEKAAGPASAYEYEPDEQDILADLLPRNVAVQIFRALLENGASEQGARMTAMDNATRNAGEMIDKLTLHYNRTRQAHITKELIEIVSGAEAL